MKSFTLGPTPKIDFSLAQQQLQRGCFNTITLTINSLSFYGIHYRILTILKPKGLYL